MRTRRALKVVVLTAVMVAASCASGSDGDAVEDLAAPVTALAKTAEDASVAGSGADGATGGVASAGGTPSSALAVAATPAPTADGSPTDGGDAAGASTPAASSAETTGQAATETSASGAATSAAVPSTTARRSSTTGRSATSPPSTTVRVTTTRPSTNRPPTTAAPTTTRPPTTSTTSRPTGDGHFRTLPPGSSLPSGDWCAARIKPRPEVRSANAGYNRTRGTNGHDSMPRVDGDFVGTTDEIIQWAACKWGIDEDWARAQAAKESWWDMRTGGDRTSDQSACYPAVRTSSGDCPESVGLLQVRFLYHGEAFEDGNALHSTAYNIDYAYAVWRSCYEGEVTWLNTVERGSQYGPGDLEGCLGVWFSGRWHLPESDAYIADVRRLKNNRVWEQSDFLGHG